MSEHKNLENKSERKESFEFSFFKMQLKASGDNQEEIRKTITKIWWLPIASLLILVILIIFASQEIIQKLVLFIFK